MISAPRRSSIERAAAEWIGPRRDRGKRSASIIVSEPFRR